MKKTTFLKVILLTFMFLQSFLLFSQNELAYVFSPDKDNLSDSSKSGIDVLWDNSELDNTVKKSGVTVSPSDNPVIRYAQLPFAGQVAICPDNNKELPKLFLCGGNDYRDIVTGIDMSTVQSITWQRFISGGSCITVSNSDCANESASPSCWVQIATGADYRANTAGQFRVIIVDSLGTPFIHYFNVFQNSLIPTAVSKSDIVTYGTGSCLINGRIAVGGFGSGYEYSFTTGTAPGAWQDSNVFTTSVPGNYTAFIRIKGVVGSCVFKVINQIINRTEFVASTSIVSPKCNGALGSIQVSVTDVNQQYKYQLFNSSNVLVSTFGPTNDITYTFTGLNAGSYRVVTAVEGVPCMIDTKTNVTVANPPAIVRSGATITTALTSCDTGRITITRSGGTGPYKFFVNIDGAGFVENTTNIIIVEKSGSYVIRVIDVNGCAATDKTVVVPVVDRPLYSISKTDGNCTGTLGQISVNVSNANGYYLEYSFNNGANYSTTNTVSGLLPGQYNVIVRYRKAGVNSGNFCSDPVDVITIGASTALTASAGVAELSGCGPTGNESQGRVRITNPQGGTPFPAPNLYRYSFDNKVTWITSNEAFINPGGPYTFYIQDASGCEYAMGGVFLEARPDAPTISVNTPVFNCDGSATSTVTVTNSGSTPKFSYDYYMDGTLNTVAPTNVFTNVTQGDHTITVNYNVLSVPTYSVLLQEDFGKGGFTTTPGINPAYCFEDEATTHLLPGYACNPDEWINDGEYAVASKIRTTFGAWVVANDHTLPDDPLGRFLCVNVGGSAGIGGILYSKPIRDVIPNQPVIISLWAQNLIRSSRPLLDDPKLTIQLVNNLNGVGGTETIVATTPIATPWVIPKSDQWEFKDLLLNPGAYTNLSFVIRSYNTEFNGNDVLIDDILVRQIPKSCNTVASFPIVVDGSKAFSASITGFKDVRCSGQTNGEITLSARNFDPVKGFQYQVDGGPWITEIPSPAATAGSVTINSLTNKTYNINIRYDSSAGSCTFALAQEIKMPTTVTAVASILIPATCSTGATIRVTGGGGTPAYKYELREADGTTPVTIYNNNRDFTNVPVGDYKVFVKDANNCISPVGFAIAVTAPPALTAVLANTTDYCYTTANPATLDVTVMGGTPPFTYQLDSNSSVSSAATTYSFANVTPGTHTILVTDSNNCTATIRDIDIEPQLGFNVSLIDDLTCGGDAIIDTPVVSGGYGVPYTYTVTHGGVTTAVASFPYTANASGTYVFTVTDSKGCPANSNTITVTPKTTPVASPSKTDITCNNANDGTITVTASGGFTSAYTYEIAGPVNASQNTNKFTGLLAGTYNVKVIDSKGCSSVVVQVTIVNPTALVVSASATAFTCSATNTKQSATVTIDLPTTGTSPYKYSFNGGSFTNTSTLVVNDNGSDQTINYAVRDGSNCVTTGSITLNKLNPPTIATITNTPIYCLPATSTTSTVTVPVTAGTGVGTLTYTITSPAAATTNTTGATTGIFTGLIAGTYVFKVTDDNGCFATKSHTVPALIPIAVTATKLSDVDCFGSTTGSARFTVSSFSSTGNYNITVSSTPASLPYTLSPSGDVRTLTGLVAGTYTFSVTDITTGCTDSKSVTITQPTAALAITNATATNVFCSNDNSQITVTATGGTTNYGYAAVLSGASAPTVFGTSSVITVDTNSGTNLVWDVYVRDAKGCTTLPFPVTIINNGSPSVTASVTNQCGASGSSFQIVAVGSGGLAPYTYTINTGLAPSPANTFTVAAGTYTITVRDANGCPATTTVTVNQALTATAIVTKDITCSLPQEATIKVDVLGGLAPFSYKVDINGAGFGASTSFGGTTFNYTDTGITIGKSYRFEITDANGIPCTAFTNVVTTNTTVTVTASETHVSPTCNGFTDGSIRLTATAGVAPFTYAIASSPSVPTSFGSANVFGGLAAGTYNYVVRDAKGCEASGTIVLNNPPAIVVNVITNPILCNANTPGSFDVSVTSGGTAPYTYRLFDNAFTQIDTYTETSNATTPVHSFTGLNFGDYYITVVDVNGCEFRSPRTRIQTPPFLTFTGIVDSNNCATGVDYTVTTTGGVGPFRYSIFGQTETAPSASNVYTFTGLLHGVTYFLQVKDSAGCISILEVTMPPVPSTIAITGTTSTNVTCNGTANGTLAFTVQNFDASVTSINYEVLNALTLLPLPTPIVGTLTGAAGGPFSGNITTLPAGNYVLKVTEATGTLCSTAYTFQITQPAQPLTSSVTSNVNANCNSGALVTLTTTGGTGPYQYAYALAPTVPSSFASGNVLTLDPGVAGTDLNWNIIVRDVNGCTFPLSVTIAKDPTPVITLSVVDKCVAQGTFGLLVTETTAGTGAYSISVDGGAFASIPSLPRTVTGLNSGPHTIIIKDANGCTDTETITIAAPLVATPAITALPTCANNDGVITMSGAGGTGTYTYTISPSPVSVVINNTTGVISGLPANTYTITMADSATPTNCTTTAVVTLGAPTPVTFTTATTPALCVGDNNGSITVTLLAGNNNPSYTYEIIAGPQSAVPQSSNIFLGLLPGTYTVRVNSGRGCSTDDTNVIVAPATPLTASAAFPANTTCSTSTVITVTAGGGTGSGYLYNFNGLGYTSDPTYTVNDNGSIQTISYRVKDANGCETLLQTIDVNPLNKPTDLNFVVSTAPTCPAPTTGVTVTATNGVGALTFRIIQFNGAPTALYPPQITAGFAVSAVFNNLPIGDYMFQVTDTFGCTYQESYTVDPVTNITVAASVTTDVTCFGAGNGTATFDITNFGGNYNYTFDGVPFVNASTVQLTFPNLTPVLHTLIVTDAITGCQATATVTISQPAAALDFSTTATKINCNNDNATITVSATGGTPTYKYVVVPTTAAAPVPTAYGLSNQLTVDTNSGANMVWDVYVMDANGCVDFDSVTLQTDANPTIPSAVATQCPSATGTYDITVSATGFSPALQYSADGSNYQSGSVITVNAPGNYTIYVKDANGCVSVGFPITILDPLILTPTVTTPVSCTINNGVISVSTTGGSGNYVYNIDGGAYALVASFPNLASGPHIIGVRDTTTLCNVFATINLQAATPITGFALAKTEVTCNGGSDGTITATMTTPTAGVNDNPVYTYTLTGISITGQTENRGPQDSPLFTGLEASNSSGYTVTVLSGRGCADTATITVGEPVSITVAAPTVVEFGCTSGNIDNLATITVTGVNGGSLTYLNYEFIKVGFPDTIVQFSASNVYQEADLAGGDYIVNVYDDKGCVGTNTARINPFIGIDFASPAAVTVTRPITCVDYEDIQVNATFTGGAAVPLDYTIVATPSNSIPYVAAPNNTGQFTDLTVGSYTITAVNPATGCEIRTIHIVNDPNTFDLVTSNIQNVVCFGTATGSVDVTFVDNQLNPTDDAGAFEYTITDPTGTTSPLLTTTGATITISSLSAGLYTVKAKLIDLPSCEVETSFTIAGPFSDLTLSVAQTPITCDPGNDGSITATGDGGWPGSYQYELVGVTPGTVSVPLSYQFKFENLTAGTYNVNVLDTGGCTETVTVTLSNPTPIIFTAAATAPILACNGDNNGEIVVNAPTGGQGSNYSYILNYVSANPVFSSAPQSTPVFSGLVAGNYTVTVIDGLGCISVPSATITINEPTKVEPLLVLTSGITCINDATVTLSATGGSGPYDYSTDANFVSTLGSFVSSITFSVGLGDHQYYVRDANNCVSNLSNNVAIVALDPLELSKKDVTVVLCRGSNTGSIDVQAVGGLGNYMYTLLDSTNNVIRPAQSTGFFEFLSVGNYMVRVDSGDCVLNSEVFNITEPPTALTIDSVVQTDVTCAGERNGSLTITTSGGTGKISFTITPNPDQTFDADANGDIVFDNLRPGVYDFTVQDQNGCFNPSRRVIIGEPGSVFANVIANSAVPEVCAGDADGAFSLNITGGVAPYSVSLNNRNGTYTAGTLTQTQFDFSGLSGNEQIVYIRDANGCESDISIMLGEPVTLNPVADVNYDCVNNSQVNSVTITVAAGNAPADLDYSLDGSLVFQTSNVFNNLSAGRHTVDVRHTNGCIKQVIFNVDQVNPITIALSDGGLNEIVSTVSGGFGNYQYSLNGEPQGSQGNFIIYKSGDYTVTVTDANGCSATATRYFEFIDIKIPNVFTPNGDGNNDTWAPTNTINYKDLIFEVFDRYGRKIGTYREGQSWNGKYNGNELPSGDYWYILRLRNVQDAREFVGHFTLYR